MELRSMSPNSNKLPRSSNSFMFTIASREEEVSILGSGQMAEG